MDTEINKMLCQTNKLLKLSINSTYDFSPKTIAKAVFSRMLNRPVNQKYRSFFWPTATLALALEWGYTKTQNSECSDTLDQYYRQWMKKGCNIDYLDQIMNGYSLIFLYNKTGDIRIKNSINTLYDFINSYPRTRTGSLPYRKNFPELVLVDYLGMVCPFLSRYGKTFNCEESLNLSVALLHDYVLNGMDRETGLPYHGFQGDTHEKMGIIGWGRGVGWLLIGMTETLAFLDKSSDGFDSLYHEYLSLLESTIKFQDDEGYFRWIVNAKEGHVDISATAMIGYSIKRAGDLDIIDHR